MIRHVFLTGAVLGAALMLTQPAAAQTAAEVIKRASDAMGADKVKSLRYGGDGTGATYGQAYKADLKWPKLNVHSMVRTLNYDTGTLRQEITISRGEPKGGGAVPLQGQQKNDFYLSNGFAWNVAGQNTVPGSRFIADRTHQLWITPHGVLKAAAKNNATVKWQGEGAKKTAILSFTEPGQFTARVSLDPKFLVSKVESRLPDPVLGEVSAVALYSNYMKFGQVQFPTKIKQSQGGATTLDLTVKEFVANPAVDIPVPEPVRAATERVTTDKVADGVWYIAGGTHHSVAIEMKDHMILVEAPLSDARTLPVLAEVKKLAPGKPIRFMINSHNHFDHSGGVRAAASEGATIVAHSSAKAFFEKALAAPSKIAPDALAKSGKKAKVMGVGDKQVMKDGMRTVEIHQIKNSVHGEAFLMVYLPKEKLLVEADAYTPLPPNAPVPEVANANNVNLIDNIHRLKLSVEKILPLHGRVVPLAELYTTAKVKPPTS
jgi:glyoxylase-like metal-dependent hydrolase (beta-lactamase superfamily II)